MTDQPTRAQAVRPLIIVAAFAASLAIGLVLTLWLLGGPRTVTAPPPSAGRFSWSTSPARP